MYDVDLDLLVCPHSGLPLTLKVMSRDPDGEVIDGQLRAGDRTYPIRNGIPRFIEDTNYNPTWDFKWRVLDAGAGHNFRIIDKSDPAYNVHDIFDRNSHDGLAYRAARGRLALDLGCGVGQYAVKLALEYEPKKVVAVDLTGGVDIFRKVIMERYQQLKPRMLIIQASVFLLPFRPETFDYVMSLGVLMHTGDTKKALDRACTLVKPGGEINAWIYASEAVAYDAAEPGRESAHTLANIKKWVHQAWWPMYWWCRFRTMDHDLVFKIVRFMSSDRMFRLSRHKRFLWIQRIFPTVEHSDMAYRLINNYDGYVNKWCDTWCEHELFPILRQNSVVVLGFGSWRIGLWGRKIPNFYPTA